ncbi:MAG: hypothetical protein QM725_04105 [Lacibacter sp.]
MKRLFPLFAFVLFFNCSGTVPSSSSAEEALLGAELNYENSNIVLLVVSKGCTAKQDFTLQMKEGKLLVTRKKKDECKMMPFAARITWTFAEAGIKPNKPFYILNPFISNPLTADLQ